MTSRPQNVAVLGSTGSIGRATLEIIAASAGGLRAVALTASTNCQLLVEQAKQFSPRVVAIADAEAAKRADWSQLPAGTERLAGPDALEKLAADPAVDVVVAAVVGKRVIAQHLGNAGRGKNRRAGE